MANILNEIDKINTAIYGKDVRGALANGLTLVNDEVNTLNDNITVVQNLAENAESNINEAVNTANSASSNANTAVSKANTASSNATQAVNTANSLIDEINKTKALPLTGGTLSGAVVVSNGSNSAGINSGQLLLNGAASIYLDANNNININSGDSTTDGKLLGQTIVQGGLETTTFLKSDSNSIYFSSNEAINVDSNNNLILDTNSVYSDLKFQNKSLSEYTQKISENSYTATGGINLVDKSNYYEINGGINCPNGGYNYVTSTNKPLILGRVYTITMLVKSTIPNFYIGTWYQKTSANVVDFNKSNSQIIEVGSGHYLASITFTVSQDSVGNNCYQAALYNTHGSSDTTVMWCMYSEGEKASSWSPSINDMRSSSSTQLMALGHSVSNLMITNIQNENKNKQLGAVSTNLMIENIKSQNQNKQLGKTLSSLIIQNIKNQKEIDTLKEQNKTLASILVNQQLKK
ncbi:alanine-zipper protein [uncultured Clostridium sp.]|uniref:alanine-zipper protein n=1 Tax=uncultured Clostridium sp. TaxID=59620 RepID=UPI002607302E|nr:alanine-zipper protein [uncultured Clostridium sp.]